MPRLLALSRAWVGPAVSLGAALLIAACASGPPQWTFQPSPVPTPAPTGSPGAPASPGATGSPTTTGSPQVAGCSADATVVQIEETITLKMVPDSVDVTADKPVCFQVTNTAGIAHNFYVGPAADIETRNKTDAVAGTPDYTSGTQTLEYTFSGDGPFEYACWIPGHLEAGMKGTITLK